MSIDRIITADASKVSPAEFGRVARSLFNPPMPATVISEKAVATRLYINRVWFASPEEAAALHDAYLAELDEIDARYALVDVERISPTRVAA